MIRLPVDHLARDVVEDFAVDHAVASRSSDEFITLDITSEDES